MKSLCADTTAFLEIVVSSHRVNDFPSLMGLIDLRQLTIPRRLELFLLPESSKVCIFKYPRIAVYRASYLTPLYFL